MTVNSRRRGFMPASGAAIGMAATLVLAVLTTGSAHAADGGTAAAAADPGGTQLVRETFTGAAAPDFTGYNQACLTGAPEGSPPHGDHGLGGCEASEHGPVPPLDAAPHGYLRLTDAGSDRTAAVLYNHALPSSQGLDVTFDAWQYGSTTPNAPADGISFFLTNGEGSLTVPGQFGGSLGYAQKQTHQHDGTLTPVEPGVDDGYLGVGLDTLGNYFADNEQRGNGCAARSPAGPSPASNVSYEERGPNVITLRGPGNGTEGYCYIAATTQFAHSRSSSFPWPSDLPGSLQGSLTAFTPPVTPESAEAQLASSARRFNVRVTPAPDPRVIVTVDFNDGTGPHQVLDVAAPTPVPPSYKFGFAASTGDFTDVHLIRNVAVETDEPLPRLNLVKQVALPRPGHLSAGDQVKYEFVVTNSGQVPLTGLSVTDPKAGPVNCPVTGLKPGETTTCTAAYTVTAADVGAGSIDNTAVAAGREPGDETVTSPPSSEHLEITEPPGIIVDKLVQTKGPFRAGQTVRYSYQVTNTGGAALDDVHVTDDHVTGISCKATTLAPAGSQGDRTTCTGTYVITRADALNGQVTNTAHAAGTADGTPVTSPEAEAMVTIGPPRLTVTKRALTPAPHFPGSTVRYEYVVTNTGPHTVHTLVVPDDQVTAVTCGSTTLQPGQSTVCHGTYKITAVDAASKQVTNIAQAFGIDSSNVIVRSDMATVTIPVAAGIPVTG